MKLNEYPFLKELKNKIESEKFYYDYEVANVIKTLIIKYNTDPKISRDLLYLVIGQMELETT